MCEPVLEQALPCEADVFVGEQFDRLDREGLGTMSVPSLLQRAVGIVSHAEREP
jgi:hypothetical protein